jgi:hypothetical protein
MNVVIKSLDPQNPASVARAHKGLDWLAALPPGVSKNISEITIFASPVEEEAPATTSADPLAIYGKMTRAFLEHLIERTEKYGQTTLEDAATSAGIPLETARAYLRNAGRTASAHKASLPIKPEWQPDLGCNLYVRAGGSSS